MERKTFELINKTTGELFTYEIHLYADCYPYIKGEEFDLLCESIKDKGLQHAISMWVDPRDQKTYLVDGRNRTKAITQVFGGVPQFDTDKILWIDAKDDDEVDEYVKLNNDRRRQLTIGEIYWVAKKKKEAYEAIGIRNKSLGGKQSPKGKDESKQVSAKWQKLPHVSDKKIADEFGLSERTVGRLSRVWEEGGEVEQAVYDQKITPGLANEVIRAVPEKQEREELVKQPIKEIRKVVRERKESIIEAAQKRQAETDIEMVNRVGIVKLDVCHVSFFVMLESGKRKEVCIRCDDELGQELLTRPVLPQ